MKAGNTPNFSNGPLGDGGIKKAIGQTSGPGAQDETIPTDATKADGEKKSDETTDALVGKEAPGEKAGQYGTTVNSQASDGKRSTEILKKLWMKNGAQALSEAELEQINQERASKGLTGINGVEVPSSGSNGNSRIDDAFADQSALQNYMSHDNLLGGHKSPGESGFTGSRDQLVSATGAPGYGANPPPNGGQAALAQAGVTVINPPTTGGNTPETFEPPPPSPPEQNPPDIPTGEEDGLDDT